MTQRGGVVAALLALVASLAGAQVAADAGGYTPLAAGVELPPRLMKLVDVDAADRPLAEVVAAIARQAGLGFTFDRALPGLTRAVTLHVRAVAAADALERALEESGLDALVSPAGHVVLVRHLSPAAQPPAAPGVATRAAGDSGVRRPTMLGAVTITEDAESMRMTEFEERRRSRVGEFFTAEEIMKRGASTVADVLRWSKTVRIESGPQPGQQFAMSSRPASMGEPCPMRIHVDGMEVNGFPRPGTFGGSMDAGTPLTGPASERSSGAALLPVDLSVLMTAEEVAGIEVYSGASTIPVQVHASTKGMCGVVLIWTKDSE